MDLVSPRPFAGSDQCKRKQRAKSDAHGRPEPTLLDRIADEEKAAERKRKSPDPDHPLGAEALFEADWRPCCSRGFLRLQRFRLSRLCRLGLGWLRHDRLGLNLGGSCFLDAADQSGDAALKPRHPVLKQVQAATRPHHHHKRSNGANRHGKNGENQKSPHVHHACTVGPVRPRGMLRPD